MSHQYVESQTRVSAPVSQLREWLSREEGRARLNPPWLSVSSTNEILNGYQQTVVSSFLGSASRLTHEIQISAVDQNSSEFSELISWEGPNSGRTRSLVERLANYRKSVVSHDSARHLLKPRLKFAVSGSSGYIGSSLCSFLAAGGHTVLRIGRARSRSNNADIKWDIESFQIDSSALENVDVVVHLAGAPIARRWTGRYKQEMKESRVRGTRLLAEAVASLANPPSVFLSGSAIGYYGSHCDSGDVDESSIPGLDYLAGLCVEWEDSALPVIGAGVRLAYLRTGIVTGIGGGTLGMQWPLVQAGIAGPVGGGGQWMSPISLDDEIGAIYHCAFNSEVVGGVNLVAPKAVLAKDYIRQAASVIGRPAVMGVPAFIPQIVFGKEMVESTIMASQRVLPTVLSNTGFKWAWPSVKSMVEFETGRIQTPF